MHEVSDPISGKNKKNVNLLSAEFAKRWLMVNAITKARFHYLQFLVQWQIVFSQGRSAYLVLGTYKSVQLKKY